VQIPPAPRHSACTLRCRNMPRLASPTAPRLALRYDRALRIPVSIARPPSRRALARRYTNILLNIALLGLVALSFVTGWVASLLGLTEFGLHKYSSIALVLVACAHVVLHWRSLAIQLRNIGTSRFNRRNATRTDRLNSPQPDRWVS
jgi:hypothetical protein